jgi:hypothetical protein
MGVVILMTGLALAGCAPEVTETPTVSPSASVEPAPSASVTPPEQALRPDGSAEDNLPFFTAITGQVWASEDRASGRAYVDALTAAGFDRAAMQVTQDLTTVGNPVESLQFSVRWAGEECLVGQVGPSTGEPVTLVVDQLAEGRCLVGNTRPIDW